MKYLLLLIPLGLIIIFIWSTISLRNQSKKDWETLKYLKQKTNSVSTKEEIEEFHKEFVEKASKINNTYIRPELDRIDAFLRGLYKQYIK